MSASSSRFRPAGALEWGLPAAALVLLLSTASAAGAQPAAADPPVKIRDNLFLLEEAYNQEPGVIQHIQSTTWNPGSRAWVYSFTEEWPVPGDRHQLSVTIPVSGFFGPGGSAVGDVLVNYRLQAIGAGGAGRLAMAPRLSLALPTAPRGPGADTALGAQFNLPVSIELGERFVVHLNGGFGLARRAPAGIRRTSLDTTAGAALVWHARPTVNGVLEVVHATAEDFDAAGRRRRDAGMIVNPGVRFALDFPSGLQVVPGISLPIQFPRGDGRFGLLAYLSLEHPLWGR